MGNPEMGPDHVADIEKKNAKTVDAWGWLHSGDKGSMDALVPIRHHLDMSLYSCMCLAD